MYLLLVYRAIHGNVDQLFETVESLQSQRPFSGPPAPNRKLTGALCSVAICRL